MLLRNLAFVALLLPLAAFGRERAITPPSANQLALTDPAYGIATGPDARIWLLMTRGLGRLEQDGSITYINQVWLPGTVVGSLKLGVDGAFRLVTFSTRMSSIGRLTTTGGVATYDIRPGATLHSATANDGRTWFTEGAKDRIGYVNAGGVVQEIALDPNFDNPGPIAIGPDQTVWFSSRRSVGHVNAAGEIEQISTASYFVGRNETSAFSSIVVDRDGSVLLTSVAERDAGIGVPPGGNIVRVRPNGEISTLLDHDSTSSFGDLSIAPDGSLWFTATYGIEYQPPRYSVVHRANDGTLTTFNLPDWPLFKGSMWGYAIDSSGTLWILTDGPPVLFRFPGAAK